MKFKSRYGKPQFEFIEEAFDKGFNFPPFELYEHQVRQLELYLNSPHFAQDCYKGTSLYNPNANGYRNFIKTWPRRAGKDLTPAVFVGMVCLIVDGRTVYYLFPRLKRAQRFWFLNNTGIPGCNRLYQMFPKHMLVPGRKYNKNTDVIEFTTDSAIILGGMGGGGEDFKDPLDRGGDLDIVVYSEYGWLSGSAAAAGFAPMGIQRKHISIYPSTPRGKNHYYRMANPYRECNRATSDAPDKHRWHVSELTREETFNHEGELLVSQEEYDAYVAQFGEAMGRQEYYGSFDGPGLGMAYEPQMEKLYAEATDRIRPDIVPQPHLPTFTGWDFGQSNATVVTYAQLDGPWLNIVDSQEYVRDDIREIVRAVLAWQKRHHVLEFTKHILPHDMGHATQHIGKRRPSTLAKIAKSVGLLPIHQLKVSNNKVEAQVAATRLCFPYFRFNAVQCKKLLLALESAEHPVDPETGRFDETKLIKRRKTYESDRYDSVHSLCEWLHPRLLKKGFIEKKAEETELRKEWISRRGNPEDGGDALNRKDFRRKLNQRNSTRYDAAGQKTRRRNRLLMSPRYRKGEDYQR